jgi:hypothetical protein
LLAFAGCASHPPAATSPDDLWQRYARAVEDAKYPAPAHISRRLVALTNGTAGLTWNEQGQILMATWTKQKYYEGTVGQPYVNSFGPIWVSAIPFIQRFCRSLQLEGDALRLRIAQRLGLPPDSQNDAFVQMWIDPKIFFRPCADPEVTDGECELNLTTVPPAHDGSCPWEGSYAGQTSQAFTTVSQGHLDWMCSNWKSTYTGDPRTSYPWTALGYTYDWNDPRDIYGESEFVVPKASTVTIQSVTPTDEYCAPAAPRK